MHFLTKWEMSQLPVQMLKVLGTSRTDCNNMLPGLEKRSGSRGPGTVYRQRLAKQNRDKNAAHGCSAMARLTC